MRYLALPTTLSPQQRRWLLSAVLITPCVLLGWSGLWWHWLDTTHTASHAWASLPLRLSQTAFGLTAAGLLISLLGIFFVHHWGWRAQQSPETMMRLFTRGQKLLPWFQFIMVLFFFCSALMMLSAEALRVLFRLENNPLQYFKIVWVFSLCLLVILAITGLLLFRLYTSFRPAPDDEEPHVFEGQLIGAEDSPQLWALVRKIANAVRAPMPDHLIAGVAPQFVVTDAAITLHNGQTIAAGQRTLHLSLPLMDHLTRHEFSGILAHELSHFAAEDTCAERNFRRVYWYAESVVLALHRDKFELGYLHWLNKPTLAVSAYFLHSFDVAYFAHSRHREYLANQAEVGLVGPKVFATALLRLRELSPVVDKVLQHRAVTDFEHTLPAVLQALREQLRQHAFTDPRQFLSKAPQRWNDSHPSLYQSLMAAGVRWDAAIAARYQDTTSSELLLEFRLLPASTLQAMEPLDASVPPIAAAIGQAYETDDPPASPRPSKTDAPTAPPPAPALLAQWKTWAEQGVAPQALKETVIMPVIGLTVLALGMLVISLTSGYAAYAEHPAPMFSTLAGIAAKLACLAALWALYQRRKHPALQLDAAGVSVGWPGSEERIDWQDIAKIEVKNLWHSQPWNPALSIRLVLAEHSEPPHWPNGLRTRYDSASHQVRVSVQGIDGIDAQAASELLHTYWQAGCARHLLQRMHA